METIGGILFIVYCIAGYWATGWTIYYNKIVIETQPLQLFWKKVSYAIFIGWILIPVAIIRKLLHSKG